jgi:transporter family-2 protein
MATAGVSSSPHLSTARRLVGAVLAALGGVGLATQGRINGQLGQLLGDGLFAALVSFGVGLALLVIAVLVWRPGRWGITRLLAGIRGASLRWWQCLGGVCGAFLVATQGITISMLGVAVFTVAVVAGQVVTSLAVDRAGIAPGGARPITLPRAAGALLAIVAIVVAVADELGRPTGLWLAFLPALAGVGLAWQLAVNGLVRAAADSVTVATLVNFAVGTAALVLAVGIDVTVRGWPADLPGQWWLYVGGVLGVGAIVTAVIAVRLVGVLLAGLSSVAGQLVGAVVLDLVAPADGGRLSVATVAGAAITMVAVGIAALSLRHHDEL